ncbi:fumarylacetoacetate hydrolase family protein [Dysgonomonas sp. 25]|uniref:fumarylacetoacetate hydrolase family protein n=1 Tax=Dysgonomonas sp. 25 TaxID=2302933 RepID=UPI0013D009A1|nr:fumarylacetoacetate hydrolase family protein [Dysgonomonas sp. 25]NDV67596.1 FAA hydrolase family protein [Dysgonomonas sp. 25]
MKIICVGLNYHAHIQESNQEILPVEPVLFIKPDSAILHNDKNQFYIPDFTSDVHYEAEIVVRIDKMGKNIAERFAHRYYKEITTGLDLTARDLQTELRKKGLPWEISKSFDNSAVIGNFVPKEKYGKEVTNLNFHLDKNAETVQRANTSEMIHTIDQIIAYASRFFTLKTGDLIFTGTPAGVGRIDIGDCLKGYIEEDELFNIQVC